MEKQKRLPSHFCKNDRKGFVFGFLCLRLPHFLGMRHKTLHPPSQTPASHSSPDYHVLTMDLQAFDHKMK